MPRSMFLIRGIVFFCLLYLFVDFTRYQEIQSKVNSRANTYQRYGLYRTYLSLLLAVAGQSAVVVAGAGRVIAPAGRVGQDALE